MNVLMTTEFPCHCGKPVRALRCGNVRVNIGSLRETSSGFVFVSTRDHDNCGTITIPPDTGWRLDDNSAAKVKTAREKLRARRKTKAPA